MHKQPANTATVLTFTGDFGYTVMAAGTTPELARKQLASRLDSKEIEQWRADAGRVSVVTLEVLGL